MDKAEMDKGMMMGDCTDCLDAARLAYSDATTPGFFHDRCEKHRKSVLDAACGSRMFWFDRNDARVTFMDNRTASFSLKDRTSKHGQRSLVVSPDLLADFSAMPFADEAFHLVVFDPPHLTTKAGKNGWQARKYGRLEGDWREMLRRGFTECFRVLRHNGTLIFKWNEQDIPVSQILALTPEIPLFGQRCGKLAKTHWVVFMKSLTPAMR